jgi:protein-tyrosine-phosphatase
VPPQLRALTDGRGAATPPSGGPRFEAHSAGTEANLVKPLAIRAMEELGIDISGQESKTLNAYLDQYFDYVITVCDDANEACPFFPDAKTGCTGPWGTPHVQRA